MSGSKPGLFGALVLSSVVATGVAAYKYSTPSSIDIKKSSAATIATTTTTTSTSTKTIETQATNSNLNLIPLKYAPSAPLEPEPVDVDTIASPPSYKDSVLSFDKNIDATASSLSSFTTATPIDKSSTVPSYEMSTLASEKLSTPSSLNLLLTTSISNSSTLLTPEVDNVTFKTSVSWSEWGRTNMIPIGAAVGVAAGAVVGGYVAQSYLKSDTSATTTSTSTSSSSSYSSSKKNVAPPKLTSTPSPIEQKKKSKTEKVSSRETFSHKQIPSSSSSSSSSFSSFSYVNAHERQDNTTPSVLASLTKILENVTSSTANLAHASENVGAVASQSLHQTIQTVCFAAVIIIVLLLLMK